MSEENLLQAVLDLSKQITDFQQAVTNRFNEVDTTMNARFGHIDLKLTAIDNRTIEHQTKLTQLDESVKENTLANTNHFMSIHDILVGQKQLENATEQIEEEDAFRDEQIQLLKQENQELRNKVSNMESQIGYLQEAIQEIQSRFA